MSTLLFERTMGIEGFLSIHQGKKSAFISGNRQITEPIERKINPDRVIEVQHNESYNSGSSTNAEIIDRIKYYKTINLFMVLLVICAV